MPNGKCQQCGEWDVDDTHECGWSSVWTESELQEFWNDHAEWSQKTFGLDSVRGPEGPLNHLAKEVQEALAKPDDPGEYADLLLLTFDAARRSGLTFGQLIGAARSKLHVNKARRWGKPNADGSVEHVRDGSNDDK